MLRTMVLVLLFPCVSFSQLVEMGSPDEMRGRFRLWIQAPDPYFWTEIQKVVVKESRWVPVFSIKEADLVLALVSDIGQFRQNDTDCYWVGNKLICNNRNS